MQALDRASMLWIGGRRQPWLTAIFRALTYTGTPKAWGVFALGLFALETTGVRFVPSQLVLLRVSLTALLAWGAGQAIKRVVGRRRPSRAIAGYEPAVPTPECGSFPSGHAAASIAFFVGLALLDHPLAPAVGVWALLVTLSRFYLGVHYPTDLAGGAVLGCLCGSVVLFANGFF